MALEPSIAMGYRGIEVPNQMAQYAQLAQLQAAQNQNALAQYQLGAAQRAEAKDIARTNALAQAGTDDVAIGNALLRAGDLKGYADFLKTRRETQKADVDLVDAKLKQSRAFLENVTTPEQYLAWHEANHRDPVLGPALAARGITADQSRARIMSELQTPGGFQTLLNQSKLGTEKFMELNKPTTQVVDQSGQKLLIQLPGLGGAPTTAGTYADVPLPKAVEEQKVRIAGAGAARTLMNVNTQLPASEEAQKEFMKSSRQSYDMLKTAPALLSNIEEAKKLVGGAKGFMGPGGETLLKATSFINSRLGTNIDTKGVSDASELRSRLFTGVIENLRKLDAQPTAGQQQALQEAIGNLGSDPNALPRILDSVADTIRQKVDGYNQEVSDAELRGVKFPYKPQIKLPSVQKPAVDQIPGQGRTAAPLAIPQAAIDALKAGRGTDAQFDEIFGPGAAKRARGGK